VNLVVSRAKDNGPGEAEANEVAMVAGTVAVAPGRAAVASGIAPTATADHAVGASGYVDPSASVMRRPLIAVVPIIFDPVPHVAVHVLQTPGVGLLFAYRMEFI
jgi:hypothetical protein